MKKYITEKENLYIYMVTNAWLEIIKQTLPKQVMIYTIARDTPISGLKKISVEVLNSIANHVKELSIDVQISA